MLLEGIQSKQLCKICSGLGDKKTSGVDAEKELEKTVTEQNAESDLTTRSRSTMASSTPKLFSMTLFSN